MATFDDLRVAVREYAEHHRRPERPSLEVAPIYDLFLAEAQSDHAWPDQWPKAVYVTTRSELAKPNPPTFASASSRLISSSTKGIEPGKEACGGDCAALSCSMFPVSGKWKYFTHSALWLLNNLIFGLKMLPLPCTWPSSLARGMRRWPRVWA